MYKTQAETRAFFAALKPLVAGSTHCDIVVAPPYTALAAAVEAVRGSAISIAGRGGHWGGGGALPREGATEGPGGAVGRAVCHRQRQREEVAAGQAESAYLS